MVAQEAASVEVNQHDVEIAGTTSRRVPETGQTDVESDLGRVQEKDDVESGCLTACDGNMETVPQIRNAMQIHPEHECGHVHLSHRAPWVRAALLGANDGLVSVASLMIGVSAVKTDSSTVVISGIAGLVAGACSMAIGEYISVYGQRDIEQADVDKERKEHSKGPQAVARELEELAQIYVSRGLRYSLARQVAEELSRDDPVRAHARDELGIDVDDLSNPLQAAMASAIAFCSGAIIPLLSGAFITDYKVRTAVIVIVTTLTFIVFGALGAWFGGAKKWKAALRTTIGGWIAMLVTYGILRAFGSAGI